MSFISLFDEADEVHHKDAYTSKLKYRNYELNWKIENFEFLCKNMKEIKSPLFPSKKSKQGQWFIELQPTELRENNKTPFKIKLISTDSIAKHINVSISIQNNFSIVQELIAGKLNCDLRHEWILTGSELYSAFGRSAIAKVIQIKCQLTVLDFNTKKQEIHDYEQKPNDLVENIENLLDNEDFKDVTFNVEDEKFTAHKNILAIRSSVFAAMFMNKMSEGLTSVVEIDDIKPAIFQKMMIFIYTDRVENLDESAFELLYVAEKYQLEKLKNLCIRSLNVNLSLETVIKSFEIADLYSIEKLKDKCLKFISQEIDEIIERKEFQELIQSRPFIWLQILKIDKMLDLNETEDDECFKNWSYKLRH
ncbi:speckle-type POZ protein-like isoform X1 [Leptopilina heterotoma]|uniref:speckle-type POZ protein-like isoform X1 n=1 Tax=Leptopilina heterotoma TaxID=63436 RepID=UPI001CA84C80|nr:speckle-type POZ protein-like isoform X1 [Leptopilina heterotoma]